MARRGGAAWRRSSGELSTAARCAGTSTSGSVGFLTSLRDSGRLHDDEEARRETAGQHVLGFRRRRGSTMRRLGVWCRGSEVAAP
jgi:hypothetical protein